MSYTELCNVYMLSNVMLYVISKEILALTLLCHHLLFCSFSGNVLENRCYENKETLNFTQISLIL